MGEDARPQHEVPYLHVRAPRRVVGVGGEGEPVAKITGNRAGLLALREQLDLALVADEGLTSQAAYREGVGEVEQKERTAVHDGWWRCETLGDVEEHERLVDRWAGRNPGMVNQSDAAIARGLLKMQRRAIERHGGA